MPAVPDVHGEFVEHFGHDHQIVPIDRFREGGVPPPAVRVPRDGARAALSRTSVRVHVRSGCVVPGGRVPVGRHVRTTVRTRSQNAPWFRPSDSGNGYNNFIYTI